MRRIRRLLPVLLLALGVWPSAAAAGQSLAKFITIDSIYNQGNTLGTSVPAAKGPGVQVPDPKATRVQVFIFKKNAVILPQAMPGLMLAAHGGRPGPGPNLAKDPRLAKLIQKYAKQQGLDPRLVQTIIQQESNFNPLAVSPKGAMGLMQLMPETAAAMGVEDPFDIEQNLRGGIRFFKLCLNRFDQNLPLALAAYNAGPGRVTEHRGIPPFKETHSYVKNIVLGYSGQAVDPAQIKLAPASTIDPACPPGQSAVLIPAPVSPPPPLDLTFFTSPSLGKFGAFLMPGTPTLKKNDQLSMY